MEPKILFDLKLEDTSEVGYHRFRMVALDTEYFQIERWNGVDAMGVDNWIPADPSSYSLIFQVIGEYFLKREDVG